MRRGNNGKPVVCFQELVEKTLERIIRLNRSYTLGKPLTDIQLVSSSNASEADGCAPPVGVHKNDLLGLEIERCARLQVHQTVVGALVDAAPRCDRDVQRHGSNPQRLSVRESLLIAGFRERQLWEPTSKCREAGAIPRKAPQNRIQANPSEPERFRAKR